MYLIQQLNKQQQRIRIQKQLRQSRQLSLKSHFMTGNNLIERGLKIHQHYW